MTNRYRIAAIGALSLLLLLGTSASALEVVIQPDGAVGQDTWVGADSPTVNHGSENYLYFAGSCTGSEWRLYIEFDVSIIAPGSTVDTAQLELYMFSQNGFVNGFNYGAYCVNEEWNESGLIWNSQPACDSAATTVFSGNDWQGAYDQWHAIEGLESLVQGWIDDPATNHGLVLKPTGGFYGSIYVWSSDYSSASLRPRLVVNGGLVGTESSTWSDVKSLYR